MLISLGLIGVGGYGVWQLEANFAPEWFIPKGNYYHEYLEKADKYFPDDGDRCFVYMG